jgi:hypothetical protein
MEEIRQIFLVRRKRKRVCGVGCLRDARRQDHLGRPRHRERYNFSRRHLARTANLPLGGAGRRGGPLQQSRECLISAIRRQVHSSELGKPWFRARKCASFLVTALTAIVIAACLVTTTRLIIDLFRCYRISKQDRRLNVIQMPEPLTSSSDLDRAKV